jgi:adenylate cyclase
LHKRFAQGLELLERAVVACPNEPIAWLLYGTAMAYVGRAAEGRKVAENALLLSPYDPFAYMFHSFIGACCYFAGDFEAAVHHSRLSIVEVPNYSTTHKVLAMSLAALGDITEARRVGARVLELEPNYPAIAKDTLPIADERERELALKRLRSAGIIAS